MRFLTPTDWRAWCSERNIPTREAGSFRPDITNENFYTTAIPYHADSGAKINMARFLLSLVEPKPETLLLIDEWSVWPSSQHMPLFTRFREALRESRPLIECPAHLATETDKEDAVSIIAMSLLFVWDCYGISSSGRDAFHLSHDEICYFASRDESTVAMVRERLAVG